MRCESSSPVPGREPDARLAPADVDRARLARGRSGPRRAWPTAPRSCARSRRPRPRTRPRTITFSWSVQESVVQLVEPDPDRLAVAHHVLVVHQVGDARDAAGGEGQRLEQLRRRCAAAAGRRARRGRRCRRCAPPRRGRPRRAARRPPGHRARPAAARRRARGRATRAPRPGRPRPARPSRAPSGRRDGAGGSRSQRRSQAKRKPVGRRLDLERALGQPVGDLELVEAARRHVVGRVGVKERGQVLDVVAADTQLGLAAAVGADAALGAEVVGPARAPPASPRARA